MGKIGKISVIPKDYSSSFPTMEKSLRQYGKTTFPGTTKLLFPYKELDNSYRTGLDENAPYIENIKDADVKKSEKERIKKARISLEKALGGVDLGPRSKFWNMGAPFDPSKDTFDMRVAPARLRDGDNEFNLDIPAQALTYAWLSVHPAIASSLDAYENGNYPPNTTYFVNNDDVENQISYKKKRGTNEAIGKFTSFSLDKRKKIARLMGIRVEDAAREEVVYNRVDNFLREPVIKDTFNPYNGKDPINVFSMFANLPDESLTIRDVIEQTFVETIYRIGAAGKVYEGNNVVFQSKEDMINYYLNDENSEDRILLEQKIELKKRR